MLNTTRSFIDGHQLKLENYAGKYVNIVNNHRVVPNVNNDAERTIYVFGGCSTFCAGCPDNGTSSAHLQQILLDNGITNQRVENYGAFIFGRGLRYFEKMTAIKRIINQSVNFTKGLIMMK
jgi:hypothetical protein